MLSARRLKREGKHARLARICGTCDLEAADASLLYTLVHTVQQLSRDKIQLSKGQPGRQILVWECETERSSLCRWCGNNLQTPERVWIMSSVVEQKGTHLGPQRCAVDIERFAVVRSSILCNLQQADCSATGRRVPKGVATHRLKHGRCNATVPRGPAGEM